MVQLPKGGLLSEFIRRSLRGDDGGCPSCISVIDPGTEYVKALVVGIEGERVNVIGYGVDRHREMPYDRGTRAVDVRLRQACESALREAEDMTESVVSEKRVPDHTIMAFPPHFVRQGAFAVRHRRTSPGQEITIRELEQVFSRVERLAVQQLARQLGADRSELSLIGSDIVDIRVGEHSVSTPLGFCGEALSVTIFNALARNQHIEIMVRVPGLTRISSAAQET